jgi:hypothetical protein
MPNFCIHCDLDYPETTTACKECGKQLKHIEDTKQNRDILGKIQIKNVEYENNNGWGPTVLIILGLITSYFLIGIPCILVGVWWSYHNAGNRKKIATEIDVLETEFE